VYSPRPQCHNLICPICVLICPICVLICPICVLLQKRCTHRDPSAITSWEHSAESTSQSSKSNNGVATSFIQTFQDMMMRFSFFFFFRAAVLVFRAAGAWSQLHPNVPRYDASFSFVFSYFFPEQSFFFPKQKNSGVVTSFIQTLKDMMRDFLFFPQARASSSLSLSRARALSYIHTYMHTYIMRMHICRVMISLSILGVSNQGQSARVSEQL